MIGILDSDLRERYRIAVVATARDGSQRQRAIEQALVASEQPRSASAAASRWDPGAAARVASQPGERLGADGLNGSRGAEGA
jgi:hypothetical protein